MSDNRKPVGSSVGNFKPEENGNEIVQKLVTMAMSQRGYHEVGKNINQYARKHFPGVQGQPWCDVFVDSMFIESYGRDNAKKMLGGFSASTVESKKNFERMGAWHNANSGYVPKVGDQIFFKGSSNNNEVNHTGIVVKVEGGKIYTMEGNSGNQVSLRVYPSADNKLKIVGYGTPDWSVIDPEWKKKQEQKVEKLPNQEPGSVVGKEQKHEIPSYNSLGSVSGSQKDMGLAIYSAFRKAGLSDAQARVMTAEAGREGSWNAKNIFGYHEDDKNHKLNGGIISWQKDRRENLERFLEGKGLIKDGKMVRSQETLDAQAEFLVNEMKNNLHGGSKKNNEAVSKFLSNPNVSLEEGRDLVGKHFIRWDIDNPKYRTGGLKRFSTFANMLDESLAHLPQSSPIAKPNPSEPMQHEQNQKPENKLNNVQAANNQESNCSQGRDGFFNIDIGIKNNSVTISVAGNANLCKLENSSLKTADAAKENNREQENNAENNQTCSSDIDMGK